MNYFLDPLYSDIKKKKVGQCACKYGALGDANREVRLSAKHLTSTQWLSYHIADIATIFWLSINFKHP